MEGINGNIPLDDTRPKQLWTEEWSNQLFVKVGNGSETGWGEVLPAALNSAKPYLDLIEIMGKLIENQNESEIRKLWGKMRRSSFNGGTGIVYGSISGIDIAFWDLKGKKLGLPVYSLIGGSKGKVKRYASLSRYGKTETVLEVVKNLLDSGYRSIKLHERKEDTLEAVKIIRKNLGYEFDLMVDMNCAFQYPRAVKFANEVSKYELKWIEEPIWPPNDFESLKKVNELVPVAAGENLFDVLDFIRVAQMDALTYYQPDVTKIGGVTPMIDLCIILDNMQKKIAFHCRPHNGWVGILSSAHIARGLELDCLVETPPNEIPEDFFKFSGEIDKDHITPDGAGLGITPLDNIPIRKAQKVLEFHSD